MQLAQVADPTDQNYQQTRKQEQVANRQKIEVFMQKALLARRLFPGK
jgi:hypothetical protein